MINVDVSKLWADAQPPPQYEAFLRSRLPAAGGDDPFQRVLKRDGQKSVPPLLTSRFDHFNQLSSAIAQPINTVVCGRPGSGKSTLNEYTVNGTLLSPQVLIVHWPFVPETDGPGEAFLHFQRQKLIALLLDALDEPAVRERLGSRLALLPPSADALATLLKMLTEPDAAWLADEVPPFQLDPNARMQLRRQILERVGIEDILQDLCLDLDISYEQLGTHKNVTTAVRDLLQYSKANGMDAAILGWLQDNVTPPIGEDIALPEPPGAQPEWQPYAHIRVLVDEMDKLAPATQRRLVIEAVALSRNYSKLYFTLAATQELSEERGKILDVLALNPWSPEDICDLLAWRVQASLPGVTLAQAQGWPVLLGLDQELERSALNQLCQTISRGAGRIYKDNRVHNNVDDAPIHALRLARGVVWACAMCNGGTRITPSEIDELIDTYWQRLPEPDKKEIQLPSFQGRKREKDLICQSNGTGSPLLDIYGEPGMGKTRLLAEAASELRCRSGQPIVCYADFKTFGNDVAQWKRRLLEALVSTADGRLKPSGGISTADIVKQLNALTDPPPVLMFDSTEEVYGNTEFLDWLKMDLVLPLVNGNKVRMVFASSTRVPWNNHLIRLKIQPVSMNSLESARSTDPAQSLVREILRAQALRPDDAEINRLSAIVIELSCGHPKLAQHLANRIVIDRQNRYWQARSDHAGKRLATEVVKPFIDQEWFRKIESPWPGILWWASILPWFDSTVLRDYLTRSHRSVTLSSWDAFFIEGIPRVQRQIAAVTWVEGGYRLSDTIREVVRRCWQLTDRKDYSRSIDAARAVWQTLINDSESEPSDRARYQRELDAFN